MKRTECFTVKILQLLMQRVDNPNIHFLTNVLYIEELPSITCILTTIYVQLISKEIPYM